MASSLKASERLGFSCGFFNSQNGDRTYSAEEFGSIFDGIIRDGVFYYVGHQLQVTFDTGLKVKVNEGRAWLLHTWTSVTVPQTLTASAADPLNMRVDAVILTVNHNDDVRDVTLSIKKGTASTKSELQQIAEFNFPRADNYGEYPLAYLTIEAGATTIKAITVAVGHEDIQGPPYVTCPLETVDTSAIYAHLENQWNEFMTTALLDFDRIDALYVNYNSKYNSFVSELDAFYKDANNRVDKLIASMKTRFESELATFHKRFDDYLASLNHIFQDFMRKHNQGFNDFVELKDKEFQEKKREWDLIHEDFYDGLREELTDYLRDQEEIWETWFQRIQGQLSDDAATNLQRQIDALSYCYVLGSRAILGIVASPVHNRAVFGPYAGVEGSRVTIAAPSEEPNLNG